MSTYIDSTRLINGKTHVRLCRDVYQGGHLIGAVVLGEFLARHIDPPYGSNGVDVERVWDPVRKRWEEV